MEERLSVVEELKSPSGASPNKETITSKSIALKILKIVDSDYEIPDIKESLKKRHEDIDCQQRMCDYLLKSFKKNSKEYTKVKKVASRLIIERCEVEKNNIDLYFLIVT